MVTRRKVDYRTLIGYLLLLAGSLMGLMVGSSLVAGYRTTQWLTSTAIIYASRVVYTTSNPTDKSKSLHSAFISYRYQVDGVTYTGDQVYQTDIPLLGREVVKDLIREFPTGSIHKVYYDPVDPESVVLKTGISNTLLLLVAPTLLFLAIGYRAVRANQVKP
jgi:hypothetical protein